MDIAMKQDIMISKLTIEYNRSRQAEITTELVEIISGAEAL
jgi:F-type H+-transporting ATPase subunit gamma